MSWLRRREWQVAAFLVLAAVCLAAACGHVRGTSSPVPSRSPVARHSPVAYVACSNSRQALDRYMSAWLRRFYAHHLPANPMAGCVAPGRWMAHWQVVDGDDAPSPGTVSDQHVAYRVDFQFFVGRAQSQRLVASAPPAVLVIATYDSSSTYDLSWDAQRRSWAIVLTSEPPDSFLGR